ncbi:pseudouridine synthase [Podospora aff. communis PSN243]|uniref:Pseudouridine synthase n=1 Tax=Podospora aff. communis PSN243 TaxID=3040156 RepID=A0AAV9H6N5_9PEZI|nr:pseudouridine synthase [Podospora aff. communis PSN243]
MTAPALRPRYNGSVGVWVSAASPLLAPALAPTRKTLSTAVVATAQTRPLSLPRKAKTKKGLAPLKLRNMDKPNYIRWTKESLVKRIQKLEIELSNQQWKLQQLEAQHAAEPSEESTPPPKKAKEETPKKFQKKMDPSQYSMRFVALKIAYLGKNYNGFEYQPFGELPTIEEELWKALVKACLIFPEKAEEVDFGQWNYSKCGRTDRGVSAFGQVIALNLRSSKPLPKVEEPAEENGEPVAEGEEAPVEPASKRREWDPVKDELQYCRVLNRLLPPDIRVLAWAPATPETFSARFSCRERQYRYFFTQPAFAPTQTSLETAGTRPGAMKDGWLDIDAMRKAAKLFEGLHDFRNFCKIDPKKQITVYDRRVFECDVVEVEDASTALPYLNHPEMKPKSFPGGTYPKIYYFHVRGSAFLWHQIRHMISILFLVGQGLEPPSVISELLDAKTNPCKPNYLMADETPLVLWDCIFPELTGDAAVAETAEAAMLLDDVHMAEAVVDTNMKDAIGWHYVNEPGTGNGLVEQLWQHWRAKKMDELLAGRLLDCLSIKLVPGGEGTRGDPPALKLTRKGAISQKIFEGGNYGRLMGDYVPVMKRPLCPSVTEVNDKYAQSQGFATGEEMTRIKYWRTALKEAKANRKAEEMAVDQ